MEKVIARFLIKLAQILGVPVMLVETIVILTKGTDVSGSSLIILAIAAGGEILTFILKLGWHQGDIQNVSITKTPKGES